LDSRGWNYSADLGSCRKCPQDEPLDGLRVYRRKKDSVIFTGRFRAALVMDWIPFKSADRFAVSRIDLGAIGRGCSSFPPILAWRQTTSRTEHISCSSPGDAIDASGDRAFVHRTGTAAAPRPRPWAGWSCFTFPNCV